MSASNDLKLLLTLSVTLNLTGVGWTGSLTASLPSGDALSQRVGSNQVLVRYKRNRLRTPARIAQAYATTATRKLPQIGVEVLTVPQGQTVESFVNQLNQDDDIEFAEPNGIYRALLTANDPQFSTQFALQSDLLNVEKAWDITTGDPNIVIAVLDTGITLTHPDLSGNLWVNPSPSGNSGLHGTTIEINWDNDSACDENDPDFGPEQCASNDPTDNNAPTYHGTFVAGIAAASTNNSVDIAGIAQDCRLMAVKVLNATGAGSFAAIAEGLIYAADNGASVINLSLGGPASSTMESAINYALDRNVVIVAAAGNDGPCGVSFPAALPGVIAVGSTNSIDKISSFSCTGTNLDLVAPGEDILSITTVGASPSTNSGTSFSSPMVAGVAALIRSLDATLSSRDVTRFINFNADDLGATGFDNTFGFGRLNAFKAVQAANNRAPFISNPVELGETFPYPNPFNPTLGVPVTIALPASLGGDDLKIKIYSLSGEKIKTLSGTNAWDGKNDEGRFVASGLYLYFAQTAKGNVKGKLTVLK